MDSGTGGALELQQGPASGSLALEASGGTEAQPFGPIMGIDVTNYDDEVIRVEVPCGTILLP